MFYTSRNPRRMFNPGCQESGGGFSLCSRTDSDAICWREVVLEIPEAEEVQEVSGTWKECMEFFIVLVDAQVDVG